MEINILIKRYSDLLTNLSFTLNRILNNESSVDSDTIFCSSEYFSNRAILIDFILLDIEHCRKNIIYLQNLIDKNKNEKGV